MININKYNVGLIKFYKDETLHNINAVYYMSELIWGGGGGPKACFSGGIWIDSLPWLDNLAWKD